MTFNFGTDPIGSLWGSWRILRNDPETLLRAATKVQAFVDTFGEGYRTTFNPAMTTAGTNLAARTVAISPGDRKSVV